MADLDLRERQVLALIAEGKKTSEICKRMLASEGTVKAVTMQLRGKLGARTRAHAVFLACQRGLLPVEEES